VVPIFGLYAARAVLSHVGAVGMAFEIPSESIKFASFRSGGVAVRASIGAAASPTTLQVSGGPCRHRTGWHPSAEGRRWGCEVVV
jgi:hypothetical protein